MRDIESALGTKVAIDLPYDPFLYLKAVNEGVPVVLGAPRSPIAERFARLTAATLGSEVASVVGMERARSRRGLLAGLRRRDA